VRRPTLGFAVSTDSSNRSQPRATCALQQHFAKKAGI
jgi:hypothetical protein